MAFLLADFAFNDIIIDENHFLTDGNERQEPPPIPIPIPIPRALLLLPEPRYIKDFENWFNQRRFSDLQFVFETDQVIYTHKVVLSRNLPMRNFLLSQGDDFGAVLVPRGFNFSRLGTFLQRFYHDGDCVNLANLRFTPQELEFLVYFFGPPDSHGFLACRPLDVHFPRLVGARRFSDGTWEKKAGASIPIHRLLLSARSDYFSSAFDMGLEETLTRKVRLPDIGDEIGDLLLKFLYFDKGEEWLNPQVILEVLYTADRLQMSQLRQLCIEEILKGFEEGTVDTENVLPVLEASYTLNIPKLRQACLALAVNNFFQIQDQDEFFSLSPELRTELKVLTDLQCNPLGARALCCVKEMLAMLKESLEIQEHRLEQVKEQYDLKIHALEGDEEIITPEVRRGRVLFLNHWAKLIENQELRVALLRDYIQKHEKIFEGIR